MADSPYISLSNNSIDAVMAICETVKTRNSENEISVNMAKGISEFAITNGLVSEKQALWIARNADYWKIPRPKELKDINGKAKAPSVVPVTEPHGSEGNTVKEILAVLQRIEVALIGAQ